MARRGGRRPKKVSVIAASRGSRKLSAPPVVAATTPITTTQLVCEMA